MVELTVVVPTYNRRDILEEALERLARQETHSSFEVVVVDDGSTDGSAEAVRAFAKRAPVAVTVLEQPNSGSGAARNRGSAAAQGYVCLFLGDDMWARPDLVERHSAFHRGQDGDEVALLGGVVWSPDCRPSPLMEWLASEGVQFGFGQIWSREGLPPNFFYTANISVKTRFLRANGGFHEAFRHFTDIDLGLRLHRAGMRLDYDPEAIVEHFHPTELPGSLERARRLGYWARLLIERNPEWPIPRRPGSRHRLKAAALTALNKARIRTRPVQTETWRFLFHEAYREGYWGVPAADAQPVRIGAMLARFAAGDPATRIGKTPSGDLPH